MITYKSGVWIADLPFAAKDELKAAGFQFHGLPTECRRKPCEACKAQVFKSWWTDSAEVVRRMNSALFDDACGYALVDHDERVEASRAGDAELEIPVPPGLDYLPFQRAGIDYIQRAPRRRVLLGDEMGLGKTIQAIGYMNLADVWTAMVVCPANLKVNWQRELERWLVEPRNIHLVDTSDPPPPDAEVVIINYERLIRPAMLESLMGWCWELLIVDEAHNLKTPTAKRTIAVLGQRANQKKKIEESQGLLHRSQAFLALTGTAMLNRPYEMWTLVHTLDPEGFPDRHKYGVRYCDGHQIRVGWDKYGGADGPDGTPTGAPIMAWDYKGASNLTELQDKLRGKCLVRRLKEHVLPELPPKRHEIIVLEPKGVVTPLKRQMKLWKRLAAPLEEINAEDRAAWMDAVARLEAELEVAFEEMSSERKKIAVAKIPAVVEHVRNLLDNHDLPKLVVFAHHHEVIDALIEAVPESVWIDGRVSAGKRQDAVDIFQGNPDCRVMIAGIRAAGEGITLTAASHEVFAELDWTPARNQQAEDRCHRIGQPNMVLIQQMVYDGSIDAMIAKLLVHKMRIAELALDRAS
jgi:SWI/SNF-related matrix-associated actin-dependent regulator 1 of chromatin subfamily A